MGSDKKDKTVNNRNKTDSLIDQAIDDLGTEEYQDTGEVPVSKDLRPESDEIVSMEEPKKEAVAKIDLQQYVQKEAYMRLAADFDNFRKRALKERGEWERQGREKTLRSFLDILDNLARGLEQSEDKESPLYTGMQMVLSQAENWLKAEGLERIKCKGQSFDPNVHDAVARVEDPSKPDGSIIEEVKRGYKWHDRLLRPASVVVSKNSEESGEEDTVSE